MNKPTKAPSLRTNVPTWYTVVERTGGRLIVCDRLLPDGRVMSSVWHYTEHEAKRMPNLTVWLRDCVHRLTNHHSRRLAALS